ncbi:MAG: deoxyribose-phosphate aldolase [Vampirovibrio sp.]|jgi:deoxyribose-phosphate aldolase|nr:deoxyribose-phosphate aldolase [Vampirovibrio sp.]
MMMITITPQHVVNALEHTLLKWDCKEPESHQLVERLCQEAKQYGFAAVCVRPIHFTTARYALGVTSSVALAGVVGFPEFPLTKAIEKAHPMIGAVNSTTKLQEISCAQMEGVDELDVVLNSAYFKTDFEVGGSFTEDELTGLRTCADDLPIKLILETDLLTSEEIKKVVAIAVACGMDTIKTSTGFITDGIGATVETITLIRQTLDALGATHVGIKASGGVKTYAQALALLQAGATRIGSSNCVAIAQEAMALLG